MLDREYYQPASAEYWTGRADVPGAYLHQVVRPMPLADLPAVSPGEHVALLGYACDEGVRRNRGRVGAAQGPMAIRRALGRLANHLPERGSLTDAGDILCPEGDLEKAQQQLALAVTYLLQKGYEPFLLGGGHDMAYGHYLGIRQFLHSSNTGDRLGILNLDAHLDLREPGSAPHSGSPFLQIAREESAMSKEFLYMAVGIQRAANTRSLFQAAAEWAVTLVEREELLRQPEKMLEERLPEFLNRVDHLYLSIDLDGFSAAFAPGVSAPSPWGLHPDLACRIIEQVRFSGKLISADLAECNPLFDLDGRTARLGAQLISRHIRRAKPDLRYP